MYRKTLDEVLKQIRKQAQEGALTKDEATGLVMELQEKTEDIVRQFDNGELSQAEAQKELYALVAEMRKRADKNEGSSSEKHDAAWVKKEIDAWMKENDLEDDDLDPNMARVILKLCTKGYIEPEVAVETVKKYLNGKSSEQKEAREIVSEASISYIDGLVEKFPVISEIAKDDIERIKEGQLQYIIRDESTRISK